jgi:hypothetical protein
MIVLSSRPRPTNASARPPKPEPPITTRCFEIDELILILAACLSLKMASDRVNGNHAFRVIVVASPHTR